jgi:hypothetical protein
MLPQHGGFTVLRGYPEVGLGGRCGVRERCLRFDLSKSRSLDKVSLKTVHARIWCENCDLSPETTDAAYYLPDRRPYRTSYIWPEIVGRYQHLVVGLQMWFLGKG